MEIPFHRTLRKLFMGILPVQNNNSWKEKFEELYKKIESGAKE